MRPRRNLPETGDPINNGLVEEVDDFFPYTGHGLIEIVESAELAVANLVRVVVVVYAACRLVEVPRGVGYGRVAKFVGFGFGASGAHGRLDVAGHVVYHGVHVYPDPDFVAPLDHVLEITFLARSGLYFVGNWLVALVPRSAVHDYVLVYRRYL